ncbi:MAG: FtsB family cell division protein [Sporichthyaceae bacterium]|jgi:cell division protein FtsB
MKVPRRSRTPRPRLRDRARPSSGRVEGRPARRALRGRVPAQTRVETVVVPMLRRSPFTRRAAILASVVFLVAVSVAYPVQRYVAQRQHIDELRQSVAAGAERLEALQRENALRHEKFWIEREARLRLHYVKPGEQAYRVTDPPPALAAELPGTPVVPTSWWGRLNDSLATASTPVEAPPRGVQSAR